ncbi:MAG TPA: beta-L-arabinofuranosidase domain-containing protein, partial [Deinococcales bacterium]|nr:beta-L-arabinofuranosidase domain-containing protein [Deinococcales bacterium]
TDEVSPAGLSGVGFDGRGRPRVWLDFPYREEPVTFPEPGHSAPPDLQAAVWQPGQEREFEFHLFLTGPDRHSYDPVLRFLYDRDAARHHLKPWMGLAEGAALAAHGLARWHYLPGDDILMETVAFGREGGLPDRKNMHVAWVSGAPYAAALLEHARRGGSEEHLAPALAVLDKIASGVAPCGAFWGEWRHDRGWSHGWTPKKGWLHPRTLGEATLFMLRAARAERERGHEHPAWVEAVRSNLDYVSRVQGSDGNLGGYYDAHTGEVVAWEGAGGLTYVAALAEGAAFLGEPRYLEAARRAGEYYARFVHQEFIHGAPEDVHLAPTSEDGYAAVIAYMALHEATGEERWLDLARRAADWTMTFRLSYNLDFPPLSFLAKYDFRSRGSDIASPSNQHLHAYGLIATREMLRLADLTGDRHYLERTRDNIACFLQFIAREDGDFNAYKGMASERFYNTNCFQPKGMLLTLSHSWSVGMVLIASLEAGERAGELRLPA